MTTFTKNSTLAFAGILVMVGAFFATAQIRPFSRTPFTVTMVGRDAVNPNTPTSSNVYAFRADGDHIDKNLGRGEPYVLTITDLKAKTNTIYDSAAHSLFRMAVSIRQEARQGRPVTSCRQYNSGVGTCTERVGLIHGIPVDRVEFDNGGIRFVHYVAPDLNYFALRQETYRAGTLIEVIEATEVKFGEPDATLFQPPDGATDFGEDAEAFTRGVAVARGVPESSECIQKSIENVKRNAKTARESRQ